jgi:UDP-glucuronate 4-epimerase
MALFLFTKNILEGKKIDLFNYGNHIRDFTYVDDIVNPLVKLIKKIPKKNIKLKNNRNPSESSSPFRIFNIGNNNPKKLREFIQEIEKKLSVKAKVNLKKLQMGDVYETFADTSKLEKNTNYKSQTNLTNGISKFIDWYKWYFKRNEK